MAGPDSDGSNVGQTLTGLAKVLSTRATSMRQKFEELYARETAGDPLHGLMSTLLANLVEDMDLLDLADQFAQAITCGLATLRAMMDKEDPFTPKAVMERLPRTHPIIPQFFSLVLQGLAGEGVDDNPSNFLPVSLVEDLGVPALFQLLGQPWVGRILHEPEAGPSSGGSAIPTIHFYETFLQAYNAQKRAQRGVFYTPDAIVAFIVRAVDALLRQDCGCAHGFLSLGLGNILDPATGTGTFLNQVIHTVKHSFDETQASPAMAASNKAWTEYVCQQFLPQMMGCEVMLAPFIVAHLLLGQALEETGVHMDSKHRLGVYLANALDVALSSIPAMGSASFKGAQGTLDAHFKSEATKTPPADHETDIARSALHNAHIHVVLGNPPYSRKSQTITPWTIDLIAPYKKAVRSHRNIQALSDDYLKFLRLAQVLVERAGWGVVGLVLNNRFLTGGMYRGVRESLCTTFDSLYVLNLHGGKKGYERVPAEVVDENVFPIAQGVCICLLVKRPSIPESSAPEGPNFPRILCHDLFGSQESKLNFLARTDFHTVPWIIIPPAPPGNPFTSDPVLPELRAEWETYVPLDQLFSFYNVGGKPGDDELLVSLRRDDVIPKLNAFLRDARNKSGAAGARLTEARQKILQLSPTFTPDAAQVERYLYRPFDFRWVYYNLLVWTRGVPALKAQCRGTLLLLCAKIVNDPAWAHVFATTTFPDVIALSNSSSVNCYVFPVSIFREGMLSPGWNLTGAFQSYLAGMGVDTLGLGEAKMVAYLYAVLSSPAYRARYDLLLREGQFPRIPLVRNRALFARLSTLGRELLALHANVGRPFTPGIQLLTPVSPNPPGPVPANAVLESQVSRPVPPEIRADVPPGTCIEPNFPRFEDNQILISSMAKFAPVPAEVWQFVVGKYPVCRQWLTARVNKPLSPADVAEFLHILGVIRDTIAIMRDIDASIAAVGHFPLPAVPLTHFQ